MNTRFFAEIGVALGICFFSAPILFFGLIIASLATATTMLLSAAIMAVIFGIIPTVILIPL